MCSLGIRVKNLLGKSGELPCSAEWLFLEESGGVSLLLRRERLCSGTKGQLSQVNALSSTQSPTECCVLLVFHLNQFFVQDFVY